VKKALLILSGITVKTYGMDTLNKDQNVLGYFKQNYELIEELDYNKHLDSYTLQISFNLKYLDPLRLTLNPFRRHKIIRVLESKIRSLQIEGYEVDLVCHSQGCWVVALTNLHIDQAIFTGSPIGFRNLLGRSIVRASISPWPWSKTPFTCDKFINLYSSNDFVGNVPSLNKEWFFGAKLSKEIDCMTSHDFNEYLHFITTNNLLKLF
jgi:hypothetical protein